MADLIDKQKLYDYVQKEKAWKQSKTKQPRYEQGLYDAWYEVLDIIKAQPSAGTERHAHWIERRYYCEPYYECSNCNEDFYIEVGTPKENEYNFCPHCGAKMDEVEKDD